MKTKLKKRRDYFIDFFDPISYGKSVKIGANYHLIKVRESKVKKVEKAKELQAYWKQAQIEISKKYFQKIEIL